MRESIVVLSTLLWTWAERLHTLQFVIVLPENEMLKHMWRAVTSADAHTMLLVAAVGIAAMTYLKLEPNRGARRRRKSPRRRSRRR